MFAFAALRPAERRDDGLWLTGRPAQSGEDEEDAAELVAACDGLEVDGLRFELDAPAARRGDPARVPERRRPRDGLGLPSSRTGTRCCGRSRRCPKPRRRPAPPRPGRGRRSSCSRGIRSTSAAPPTGSPPLNVITLKWWGRRAIEPELPRAPRPARQLPRRLEVPARARARRSASSRATSPRPATRRPTCAPAWSWRTQRLDEGDTFVFSHLKATDMAGHTKDPQIKKQHDRGARRRARRPADRPRDRLRHRRPRDADVSGRDPLGRPGAVHRQRPGRPRRRGRGASASSTARAGSSATCAGRT